MRDLEIAKQILKDRNLSLVMSKEDKILFESSSSGINGLIQAINELNEDLNGSSVADKIVGRAVALLLVSFRPKEVYAFITSSAGLKVLQEYDIPLEYDSLVPKVLDRMGKNICPFEKFSFTIRSPDEAYEKLNMFSEKLRKGNTKSQSTHKTPTF